MSLRKSVTEDYYYHNTNGLLLQQASIPLFLDIVQTRILIGDDIMLNPASGVKMISYTSMEQDQEKAYNSALSSISEKIIKGS